MGKGQGKGFSDVHPTEDAPDAAELEGHRPVFAPDGSFSSEEGREALLTILEKSRASGIDTEFSTDDIRRKYGIKRR